MVNDDGVLSGAAVGPAAGSAPRAAAGAGPVDAGKTAGPASAETEWLSPARWPAAEGGAQDAAGRAAMVSQAEAGISAGPADPGRRSSNVEALTPVRGIST